VISSSTGSDGVASDNQRTWISDLQPGTEIEESFVVRSKDVRQRRGGGPFLAGTLGDKTGEVASLVWENVEQLGKILEVGSVVTVKGQVQRYNNRLQIVIRRAVAVAADKIDEALYVRSSSVDVDLLWQRLTALVEGVENEHLRQLLFRVISDPEIAGRFRISPAARGMHHAFRSGLLEHTVSMAIMGLELARHYALNADLVVAGCILHDLGKIWELDISSSIEYTDEGRLLGHLTMEVLFVDRLISEMSDFPDETRRQLLHILLAHHGRYEYGSPRRPKTPEALVVHMVDLLDSKMAGMMEAINADGDPEAAWSPFSKILDRFIYRRRLPDES
jgi:3'-5' exoribonuclease